MKLHNACRHGDYKHERPLDVQKCTKREEHTATEARKNKTRLQITPPPRHAQVTETNKHRQPWRQSLITETRKHTWPPRPTEVTETTNILKLRGKAYLSEHKIHNNMDALSPPIRNGRSKNLSKEIRAEERPKGRTRKQKYLTLPL